jgi:hypothetical protein
LHEKLLHTSSSSAIELKFISRSIYLHDQWLFSIREVGAPKYIQLLVSDVNTPLRNGERNIEEKDFVMYLLLLLVSLQAIKGTHDGISKSLIEGEQIIDGTNSEECSVARYFPSTGVLPNEPNTTYIAEADKYFNQLESNFTYDILLPGKLPSYAPLVARWEWPPDWYRLTGFKKVATLLADTTIRDAVPCICVDRTHVFSPINPFARSVVTFYYGSKGAAGGDPIYIYEEFTFNDLAEMTFIEAWSITKEGFDTLTQLAQNNQPWPDPPPGTNQTDGVTDAPEPIIPFTRLSTQIPGLGLGHGEIDLNGEPMNEAARQNPTIAEFQREAHDFGLNVIEEVIQRQLEKFEKDI